MSIQIPTGLFSSDPTRTTEDMTNALESDLAEGVTFVGTLANEEYAAQIKADAEIAMGK